jgi:hypothetical protein
MSPHVCIADACDVPLHCFTRRRTQWRSGRQNDLDYVAQTETAFTSTFLTERGTILDWAQPNPCRGQQTTSVTDSFSRLRTVPDRFGCAAVLFFLEPPDDRGLVNNIAKTFFPIAGLDAQRHDEFVQNRVMVRRTEG